MVDWGRWFCDYLIGDILLFLDYVIFIGDSLCLGCYTGSDKGVLELYFGACIIPYPRVS